MSPGIRRATLATQRLLRLSYLVMALTTWLRKLVRSGVFKLPDRFSGQLVVSRSLTCCFAELFKVRYLYRPFSYPPPSCVKNIFVKHGDMKICAKPYRFNITRMTRMWLLLLNSTFSNVDMMVLWILYRHYIIYLSINNIRICRSICDNRPEIATNSFRSSENISIIYCIVWSKNGMTKLIF